MKLSESVTKLLESALSRCLREDEKKDFKENPEKYLVSLLLVIEKRMKEDWISAMLSSTVEKVPYDNYLEKAQKILEGEGKHHQKKETSKK